MKRRRFKVWFPDKATCGQVYGMDGFTYWCKDWDEPNEDMSPIGPDNGFTMNIVVKDEYVSNMTTKLTECGGCICDEQEGYDTR